PFADGAVWVMGIQTPLKRTDGEGRVAIPEQERGPVTVVVASATVAHQRFDHLVPDGTEIELRLSARTKLRGRVVDSSGRPVAEAWCAALRGFDYLAAFGTDAQGRFETEL